MSSTTTTHELQSTLQALGYNEDGVYYKTKDCLNAAKDLLRYLRRDDENERTVRLELLRSDAIGNDFIPILKSIEKEKNEALFDVVLRLLVNLTQSSLVCYDFKTPADKLEMEIFMKIDECLKRHKEAFADVQLLKYLGVRLKEILAKSWKTRLEEEEHTVERILLLVRNVLYMKSDTEANTHLSTHDKLILALHKSDFLELLIKLCNSRNELKYTNYLLEILKLLIRTQCAASLAISNDEVFTSVQKEKDSSELNTLKTKDDYVRRLNRTRLNPRHSRFAGTYTAMNMKAINDNNYQICHKPAKDFDDLLDDCTKRGARHTKTYLLDLEGPKKTADKRVDLSVRKVLHHFCDDFLKRSYNVFMSYANDMNKRQKLLDNEICWFYTLAQFFMEFCRNLDNANEMVKYERMKATFSLEMFHSLEGFITRCIEMFRIEKREIPLWIKRMHKAIKFFQECLLVLKYFDDKTTNINEDDENSENLKTLNYTIKNIKTQLFSIPEFREFFTRIFKDFNRSNLNICLLRALIEANQVFFDLLEKQKPSVAAPKEKSAPERAKYTVFDTYANEIFDALKTEFDKDAEKDEVFNGEDAKEMSIQLIHDCLDEKDFVKAVLLFRQVRVVFPAEANADDAVLSIIDEFEKLKALYVGVEDDKHKQNFLDDMKDDDDVDLFDFSVFLNRYTHPHIIKFYINIFGEYASNTDYQNKCCLKMFKNIAEKTECPQYFYQLSLFHILNKFYKDPLRKLDSGNSQEVVDFFRPVLRRFFDRLKENSDLYLTTMFLKDREYLDGNDDMPKETRKRNKSVMQSNTKYDEHLIDWYHKITGADDAPSEEKEILDRICEELKIHEDQKKRICKRLVELELFKEDGVLQTFPVIRRGKSGGGSSKKKISKEWSEEDHEEIRVFFEKLKEEKTEKIVDVLKKSLKANRKKSDIIAKLIELNLISNKKELYGKSGGGGGGKKKPSSEMTTGKEKSDEFVRSDVSDSDSSSSSPSEDEAKESDEDKEAYLSDYDEKKAEERNKSKATIERSDSEEREEEKMEADAKDESDDESSPRLRLEESDDDEPPVKILGMNNEDTSSTKDSDEIITTTKKRSFRIERSDDEEAEEEDKENKTTLVKSPVENQPKRKRLVIGSDDEDM